MSSNKAAEPNNTDNVGEPQVQKRGKRRGNGQAAKAAQHLFGQALDAKGRPKPAFQRAVLTALRVQRPLVIADLRRLVKKYPDASPAELAERISRRYVASLTATGAAAGGVGAVPGVGTAASLGASFGAALGFLELTALYAQAIAELAGFHTTNDRQAQALVMTIMLGEEGRALLRQAATAQPGTRFGTLGPAAWIASGITGLTERAFNALTRRFMVNLVRGEAVRFLGRIIPFGLGAGIGGFANRNLGRQVVVQTSETFGQLPQWSELADFRSILTTPKVSKKKRRLGTAPAANDGAVPLANTDVGVTDD